MIFKSIILIFIVVLSIITLSPNGNKPGNGVTFAAEYLNCTKIISIEEYLTAEKDLPATNICRVWCRRFQSDSWKDPRFFHFCKLVIEAPH